MAGAHKTVKPLYEYFMQRFFLWDSRIAAQGIPPLVRNEMVQGSPNIHVSGLPSSQIAHTELSTV